MILQNNMTIPEVEALEAAETIRWGVWLLIVLSVCATILLVLALRQYAKDQEHEHAERMASIQATKDIGRTAWACTDVHKDELIRAQAREIAELKGWRSRTEQRMKELKLTEVFERVEV